MKIFICNKAGSLKYCRECPRSVPMERTLLLRICPLNEDQITMIRYRAPLEVAMLKEIVRIRARMKGEVYYSEQWWAMDATVSVLWTVLKDGRG
ncbi:MAG: hypothetical protein WCS52_01820 [bacterium]